MSFFLEGLPAIIYLCHYHMLKRILDFCLSGAGLIFLLPLLLLVAVIVKLSSQGPILFCQKRIGKHGKEFLLYKFRTMTVLEDASEGRFDAGSSARVTGIGKILRKTKIDELPQLWNVVRGDMSLVGPRPEIRKWVDAYPERWTVIHQVRPGITDPASIYFRNEEAILAASEDADLTYRETILPKKLDLYDEYIRNRSLKYDVFIILKTIWIVIFK